MNVLKHFTHCWIEALFIGSFGLSLFHVRSLNVNSGALNLPGSNSLSSKNSPFQIFSASFRGTGGEWIPTETASLDDECTGAGSRLNSKVVGRSPVSLETWIAQIHDRAKAATIC